MKRYGWVSLLGLTLILVGCGPAQTANRSESSEVSAALASEAETSAENVEQLAAEVVNETVEAEAKGVVEGTEETEVETAAAVEDAETVVEESTEITDQETVAGESQAGPVSGTGLGSHPATCNDPNDPFDGETVKFPAEVWNAEQLARFVDSDLVDPESGLETNFCLHSVDYSEIISGGPAPDGIPPIDNPNFDSIAEGDTWLSDVQPVIALVVGEEAKAYPLAILTRHEIANDEIADIPVAVTFCPLCNAGIVFNREVDGEVLRFGVSGNLRNSDLIMWDNKTLSWWQQFTGEAIVGDMTGTQLEMIPAQMVAWKDFKAAFPDGRVLSTNGRNYGRNPYAGYDSSARPFLFLDTPDPRLAATDRVLGFFSGDTAIAYPLSILAEKNVIEDAINGQDVVIFYEPGQASALDQAVIENSRRVGSAAMFIPKVDGQPLTFSFTDGIITDNETGSEWDVFGRAVDGELAGAQLEPVLSHTHSWFAWAAFRPDTAVYGN